MSPEQGPYERFRLGDGPSFSSEQKEALKQMGYCILHLTSQSFQDVAKTGVRVGYPFAHPDIYEGYPFKKEESIFGEVAIRPGQLFLSCSMNQTEDQQKYLLGKLEQDLIDYVPGVGVLFGTVADYTQVAYLYYAKTKNYLFAEKEHYASTRTSTPGTVFGTSFTIGSYDATEGLSIHELPKTDKKPLVGVVPLLVPAERVPLHVLEVVRVHKPASFGFSF